MVREREKACAEKGKEMTAMPVLREKKEGLIQKKLVFTLLMDLLIAVLGVTSLYEKFFLIDGVIAFRAFTVDGNLFTTIVSIIAVITGIKALLSKKENESACMYFLWLCAAVTETVIFLVVMLGYLPFVPDTPKITPYHMFCLHVAIPVLAVARFILFSKPQGVVKPSKLLRGAIPIGVYGLFVVIAIRAGVLPTAFVPYSFLDFEHNYIWYFLFALFAIPGLGYLGGLLFYRTNMAASALWYNKEDVDALKQSRQHSVSRFDVVNSGITIIFALLAILLLSFSLMTNSNTSTKVQQELMSYVSYLVIDDCDKALGMGTWHIENGSLYKGDTLVSDGKTQHELSEVSAFLTTNTIIYIKASDMAPELAAKYNPDDYVCMVAIQGVDGGPLPAIGDVMPVGTVNSILDTEEGMWYEQIKYERPLTELEQQYKEQLRNTKEAYYHFCMTFGATMDIPGVGIIEIYVPMNALTEQIKQAEMSSDYLMATVIIVIFIILYIITRRWIKSLEKAVVYLKRLAKGDIPEEPVNLGKRMQYSGLTREINEIREEKLKK